MNAIGWVAVGFTAAALAAVFDGAGTVLQAKAAQSRDMVPVRRETLYAVGVFVDVLGWALTVVALRFLPVFAVQAIVAGQTAVTVVLAHLVLRSAIHSTDLLAIACTGLGLAALAASATADIGWTASSDVVTAVLLGLLAAVVLAAVWAAHRGAVARSVVTGLAFGGSAVSVRALLVLPGFTATPIALLTQPLTYAVIGYAAVGVPLYASALRRSTPAMPSAIVTMIEVVVPGALGMVLLGDGIRPGWWTIAAGGLLLASVGVTVLAMRETARARSGFPAPPPTSAQDGDRNSEALASERPPK
ncbi:hypothetical protein [Umezawaea sp. Da 62-37]|uniref:hypothetical protein n=1 Tax=Umezawaea sp. Da 62-37 TaxID=3075927 RepID=UPI0028F72186|nr:hypothetical protein [Umezawaea sp. Da 62-37]WNV84775.1 hypothetical protein RM788_42530 [Umezawaea sp. Da 62-37]